MHFPPVGEVHLGSVAELYLPMIGRPLHKSGSSEAMSARSPGCQIAYPGGAGINPCPGSRVPVAWNSHYLLLMCGISPWVPERMPVPSL